jgi:hypothetical protein
MRSHGITFSQAQLRSNVIVPKLEQDLPGLHAIPFLYRQFGDLPARGRREAGTLTGLDGAGPRVGDCFSDRAAAYRCSFHLDGIGAAGEHADPERHERNSTRYI